MKTAEYLLWFERILNDFVKIKSIQYSKISARFYDFAGAQAWVSEAGSAISLVFPLPHYCSQTWNRLAPGLRPETSHGGTLEELRGVFQAATKQLREGRLSSLIDGIRTDAEGDLLDQAAALSEANYLAAAVVIAGGALESHLKHLASKNNLAIPGEGSISKYNDAISKARNDGIIEVYSATDAKQVTAWGGIRNDAAHDPKSFSRTQGGIRLMIDGIRQFIVRVS